jgi:hypothetical protein
MGCPYSHAASDYGDDKSFTIQTPTECWNEEQREEMKSEVYAMIYIRDHSDIPVPEIFDFDITPDIRSVHLTYGMRYGVLNHGFVWRIQSPRAVQ